jgi:hypothetical protein
MYFKCILEANVKKINFLTKILSGILLVTFLINQKLYFIKCVHFKVCLLFNVLGIIKFLHVYNQISFVWLPDYFLEKNLHGT